MTSREKELLKFLAGSLCCENGRNDNNLCSELCPYRVDGKCTDPDTFTDTKNRIEAIQVFLKSINTRTEYRIVGRFRKDDKPHVVDWNRKWTREGALHRLDELKDQSKREMERKKRDTYFAGSIGVGTEYYSEYDLLDLKIQSREVTPWSDVEKE